jgi:hypothetical protein
MATITVFASSLFMASALVLIKYIELKNNNKNILLKFINRFDSTFNKIILVLKFKILQLIQSIRYIILVEIKRIGEDLLKKAQEKVINEYKKRQEAIIVGKKEIVNKGSVSFYLKKITEDKCNGEKGKIE